MCYQSHIMPRNKKSTRSRSSSPDKKAKGTCQTENISHDISIQSGKRDEMLTNVQEMFNGKVEPDVVHMVLTECDWEVEEAIDTLFSLTEDGDQLRNNSSNKLFELASSVLTGPSNETTCTPSDNTLSSNETTCSDTNKTSRTSLIKRGNKRFVEGLVADVVDQACSPHKMPSHCQTSPKQTNNNSLSSSKNISSELESTEPSLLSECDPDSSETLMVSNLLSIYGQTEIPTLTPSGLISLMKHDSCKHVDNVSEPKSHVSNTSTAVSTSNQISFSQVLDDDAITSSQSGPYLNKLSRTSPQTFGSNSSLKSNLATNKLSTSVNKLSETEMSTKVVNIEKVNTVETHVKTVSQPAHIIQQSRQMSATSKNQEKNHANLNDRDVVSMNCDTVSCLTSDEKRLSPYILSPQAAEFVPSTKYCQVSTLISPVFYNGVEVGGANNVKAVHPVSLINPYEMSTPGAYVVNKDSAAKTPWFKPSDGVLLSDILKQSSKNVQPRMKQSPPKATARNTQKELIERYVNAKEKLLVILRGCPGSGKSTLARQIRFGGVILTTDDFFMLGNFYEYDQGLLGDAHQWNQQRSENSMKAGISPIIIDNTNSQKWEMKPYVLQAEHYKYSIELLEPQTKWRYRARELSKRNSHGVGLESIQKMLQRFEYKVSVDDIITYRFLDKTHFRRPSADERKKQQPSLSTISDLGGKLLEKRSSESAISDVIETNSESSDPDVIIESVEEVDLCEDNLIENQYQEEINKSTTNIIPGYNQSTNIQDSNIHPLGIQFSCSKQSVINSTDIPPVNIKPLDLDIKPPNIDGVIVGKPSIIKSSDIKPSDKVSFRSEESHDTVPSNNDNISIICDTKESIKFDTILDDIANKECDTNVEVRQQQLDKPLCDSNVQTIDLDTTILTDDTSNSLSNVELDMLADIKSKLKDIQTSPQLDDFLEEFDALLHLTALSDTRKNSLQSVVATLVEQVREGFGKPIQSVQLYTIQTSITQTTSKSIKNSVGDLNSPRCSEITSWGNSEPKPQRKPRRTSEGDVADIHIINSINSAETGACQIPKNTNTDLNQNNKNVDTSGKNKLFKPQKIRKKANRRPTSPFLLDQERFLTSSWTFPLFEAVSNPVGLLPKDNGNKRDTGVKTVTFCSQSTNTSPKDFNVLHCVNDGYKTNLIGTQFHMLVSQERDINADCAFRAAINLTANGYLDKSTTTEDSQMNDQFNLDFLQNCFSEVPVEELKDILLSCAHDVGWAVNIILDWGYDSIGEHPSRRKKIMLNRLRSSHEGDEDELSLHSIVTPGILPLTLVDLCSESLKTSKSFREKKIEDLLIAGSEKRLEIVEKMTMRVQRLLSSDNKLSAMDEIWVKQGTQLCSYTDSEDESENTSDNIDSCEVTDSEEFDAEDLSSDNKPTVTEDDKSVPVKLSALPVMPPHLPTEKHIDIVSEEEQSVKLQSDCEAGDVARIPVVLAEEGIRTLLALFGPLSDASGMKSCVVEVDYSLAKTLHNSLKESLAKVLSNVPSSKHNDDDCVHDMKKDKNLSESEPTEQSNATTYQFAPTMPVQQQKRRIKLPSLKIKPSIKPGSKQFQRMQFGSANPQLYAKSSHRQNSPLSFREIQEEELAKQLSKEEHMRLLEARGDTVAISTRLKRQKLQERFPGVDDAMLDEFFEENQFVLEDTSRALQAVLGSTSPRTVMTAEMAEKHENYLVNLAKEKSLQEISPQKKLPVIRMSVTSKYQSVETPDYKDFRAEAITHHQLRLECFQKAQEAFRRGMKDVAVFYSSQGHLHTEKLREANHRASDKILEYRNANLEESSTIDLHGLHPNEAVHHLSSILQQRHQELLRSVSNGGRQYLSVITGKGVHSRGGKAKVKPAIVEFLKRSAYSWSDLSSGLIRVVLRT